ncbi:hypothetical protein [Streptomyces silvensis]|uniref:Uncharacterized protein n=1 Tax=Streptomyces silvensis TaxID=1765722 RepID=A0A0W7XBI7_9ACTN|nr:hypothetical protein [Streptomyces silvensis]KUF20151.1 hypothetical protein AT728_40230 [Streptomyces silvensis]
MGRPVPHRFVLNLFHLLKRADPSATVTGTKEIVRIADTVFTLSLAPTHRHDTYEGFRLTAISPTAGPLSATVLTFTEHKVTTGTGAARRDLERLDPYNHADLINGVFTDELEKAVTAFTTTFAPHAHV